MKRYTTNNKNFKGDIDKIEAVTTCVGFDDILDETLPLNYPHLNTMIVVTSHDDKKTKMVAQKHGAICVETDLFKKNGRKFNKGAAINAGFDRFQYYGWRMHIDSDVILPDNFRRLLLEHTHLEKDKIYGADRINIIGSKELEDHRTNRIYNPHSKHRFLLEYAENKKIGARYVDTLRGYCPIGFFQLWHSSCQQPYPHSIGDASHDDVAFSSQWPLSQRVHLPTIICYHLCTDEPKWGENWEGRKQKRFNKK